MSAGKYSTAGKYTADGGTIHPIRVQPETLTMTVGGTANAAPAGAVNSPFSAKISKNRRGYGLKPRSITIRWDGAAPDGYDPNGLITLPILQAALFNSAQKDTAVSYLGSTAKVVYKTPESLS